MEPRRNRRRALGVRRRRSDHAAAAPEGERRYLNSRGYHREASDGPPENGSARLESLRLNAQARRRICDGNGLPKETPMRRVLAVLTLLAAATSAQAEVRKIVIETKVSPAF